MNATANRNSIEERMVAYRREATVCWSVAVAIAVSALWSPVQGPRVRASLGVTAAATTRAMPEQARLIDRAPEQKTVASGVPASSRPCRVLARGLVSPDGIVLDAQGDAYVSEEDAARIVRMHRSGARETVLDASTPLFEEKDGVRVRAQQLRSPEGVALATGGILYVVEDVPGGRLLAYPIDEHGRVDHGDVVDLPVAGGYAWESIDVGPAGELLLAGSSVEQAVGGDAPGAFEGVILYRDDSGAWWIPRREFLGSFSAACFTDQGRRAFYASELSGEVGCLDLTSHELHARVWEQRFRSPEGLCALPDGSVIVVEEGGRISRLDLQSEDNETVKDGLGTVESVCWDERRGELLVTADGAGQVLALPFATPRAAPGDRSPFGEFPGIKTDPYVPAKCPGYLAKVMVRAGFDAEHGTDKVAFADMARRLALMAIDARATLLHADGPVADPIDHVQFAVFAPNLMGFDLSAFTGPVSAFAAHSRTGGLVRTCMVERRVLRADVMAGTVDMMGLEKIGVPFPGGARLSSEGVASIHFLGLGVTPDYSIVINPEQPAESYMLVMQPDGHSQQYRLELPAGKDRDHWIVALRRNSPDAWTSLGTGAGGVAQQPATFEAAGLASIGGAL